MKKVIKYSLGGFLKKLGNGLGDLGMGVADTALSGVGLTDVIDKSNYSTSLGKKADNIIGTVAPIAGQIAATAIGGPGAGAALGAVQAVGKGINGNPQAEEAAQMQARVQAEELQKQQRMTANQSLNNTMTMGVTGSGYYAKGGPLYPDKAPKPLILQGDGVEKSRINNKMMAVTSANRMERERIAGISTDVRKQLDTIDAATNPPMQWDGKSTTRRVAQVASLGRGSMNPYVRGVGIAGTVVGAGMDMYDASQNYNQGNYTDAIGNMLRVGMSTGALPNYAVPKRAMGGPVGADYEVEEGEMVQGQGVMLEEGTQHASDMHKVGGESHEQGGTMGAGGERVFSDRLKPQGVKATYAQLAEKLGKDKGKLEDKMIKPNEFSRNTATRMMPRVESTLDNLFMLQESTKAATPTTKFAAGGPIPDWYTKWAQNQNTDAGITPPRPTGSKVAGWQMRMRENGMYEGLIDGKWGPKSQAAYEQYTAPMPQMQMRMDQPAAVPMQLNTLPEPAAVERESNDGGFDFGKAASFAAGLKNTFSKENMTKAAGVAGQVGTAAAPYIDNIVNAFIKPAQVRQPSYVTAPQLNTNVNINPELAMMSTQGRVLNQSIDNSSANSATANANKTAAYIANVGQAGQLYGNKRNQEVALMNQQAMLDGQANTQNTGIKNNYLTALTAQENDARSMISANAANASLDMQGQIRDKALMENDLLKTKLIADRYKSSGVLERKEIETMLQMARGDEAAVAKQLGMTIEQLRAKRQAQSN